MAVQKDMTKGNPARLIWVFTMPMLIGNVFQQMYNMVDSIVVGRFVGKDALAAVGTGFPVMFVLVSLVIGLSMGASVIISQLFGAGQNDKLRRAVSTALISQFISAVLLSIIGIYASGWLLTLLRTPKEIMADALAYLHIIFGGLLFMFAYNGFSAILRGLGDSKTPLYFLIIATAINTVLDVVFVVYMGMGVAGVAWATVIAQGVSSVLCIIYIHRRIPLLRFTLKDLVFDRELFSMTLRYGIPSSIQQVVVSCGIMAVQGLVNSYGSIIMAAYTAASRIDSLAMMPVMNFGMASSSFTGQNIGAGNIDRVRKGFRSTMLMVCGICIFITILVLSFGTRLVAIFVESTETQVIAVGTEYMSVVSCFYVLMGVMHIGNGVLRGAGDMVIPMISTIISLMVRVGSAYFMSAMPSVGYRSIWWSIPMGWGIGASIPIFRYLTGKWKDKGILGTQPGN